MKWVLTPAFLGNDERTLKYLFGKRVKRPIRALHTFFWEGRFINRKIGEKVAETIAMWEEHT